MLYDLYEMFKIGKPVETESSLGVAGGWRKGRKGGVTATVCGVFLFGAMKMFWN